MAPLEQKPQRAPDPGSGNLYIRNMLANIERTFLPIGSTIGKYRILEEIDRGGMAVVYKATQLDLDREVALKVMPSNLSINRRFMERFMSEAHAIAKLSHPNIVSIHEVAVENNTYYLAMEYIGGQNLFYYLNFNKPKLVDVLEIVARLADALAYAHAQKIIHRDLKLNNVIMRDRLSPVLIDFGLAKAMEDEEDTGITKTGEIMGSPSYMAPERLLGGVVDHRSDICSLGIMLYEMLTFKNPYLDQRNLHQTAINVMEANPIAPRKLLPWLPSEIEAITLKAMAKDPGQRYQTMDEFKDDIKRYQNNEPVLAQPPSMSTKARYYIKKHWPTLTITLIVLLFSALFGTSLYIQNKREQSHWQLFYSEKFSGKIDASNWKFLPDSLKGDSLLWSAKSGTLSVDASQTSFARLELPVNRDIKIEFDIGALGKDLYNAGFFMFGEEPDSAYCFYVNKYGDGRCGITFPGSSFLFQTSEPGRISIAPMNHVIIERIQNAITFNLNGIIVTKVWDFLPPLGKTHEQLGFFVKSSSAWFDNLRIYRRAVPLVPSPTLVADRFWERGDFDAALEEYRGLLVDIGSTERAKEIQIKIADCLVRLGRYQEAFEILKKSFGARSKDEALEARKFYLQGILLSRTGSEEGADSVFKELARAYPASPVNTAAMVSALVRSAAYVSSGQLDAARRELSLFASQYPRHSETWGKLGLLIIEQYARLGTIDSAIIISESLLTILDKNSEVYTATKAALGGYYLDKNEKGRTRAGDLWNQCITSHLSSQAVWEAWAGLAAIYEYDFMYQEATAIYQKIFRESPPTVVAHWMAGIKLGELGFRDSTQEHYERHFEEIAKGDHPFPLPRLIARFYLGEVTENQFKTVWNNLFPDDFFYLYYFARKAMFKREQVVARIYLQDLKQNLGVQNWHYTIATKIFNNLDRW